MLCNPCDAETLPLKLSAYLRFMTLKHNAFLEDDRNKFAEEAPWYLGKRSGWRKSQYRGGFIDYPISHSWRQGKRAGPFESGTVDEDLTTPWEETRYKRLAGYEGISPAAVWRFGPGGIIRTGRSDRWSSLMNQPW